MTISNEQIYELLLKLSAQVGNIEKDVSEIKQKVNTIAEHVARIDERLTQTEKVTKLFNQEVLDKIAT